MIPITVQPLLNVLNGRLAGSSDVTCSGVSIDSRTISKGSIFFAIRGETFDGHDFINKAVENGAACVVVERQTESAVTQIIVEDTIIALGRLAAWYRQQIPAHVIAITGSVGKTTTRQILYAALSRQFRCRQAVKSFNNHIGVPLTILSAEPDDEILLLELGSNNLGEIKYLTQIAKPDTALITYVGPAHLQGFGSLQNILVEKTSIAEGIALAGRLCLNGDQVHVVEYVKSKYNVQVTSFGTKSNCDIVGQIEYNGQSSLVWIDGRAIQVSLPGTGNLMNVLGAWAICKDRGLSLDTFSHAVESMTSVEKRLEIKKIANLTVLDDCYNANPVSMANALQFLGKMPASGSRKVFIAGTMRELGEAAARYHNDLGIQAVKEGVNVLLTCGPFASEVLAGAQTAAGADFRSQSFPNTADLCDNLGNWIQVDDIILVKGSRAEKLETAIDRLRELYER